MESLERAWVSSHLLRRLLPEAEDSTDTGDPVAAGPEREALTEIGDMMDLSAAMIVGVGRNTTGLVISRATTGVGRSSG